MGPVAIVAPTLEQSMDHCKRARALRHGAAFVGRIQSGESFESLVANLVNAAIKRNDLPTARSIAQSLQASSSSRMAGHLGAALVACRANLPDLAWASFAEVPRDVWRRHALLEYVRTAFGTDRERAVAEVRSLVAAPPPGIAPEVWLRLVVLAFAAKEEGLAEGVFEVAERAAGEDPDGWSETVAERARLRLWLDKALRPAEPVEVPAGHVSFAVLDYQHPDQSQASSNIGDAIQTLASLGHVVRHQKVRFAGPQDLVDVMTDLRDRVRPEHWLDSPSCSVTLVPAQRDATSYDPVPPGTWAIAFGWYMHGIGDRYDIPLNPNLRPLFLSFHCNRREMLTPEAIAYLRGHGPIGCRDWTTVDLLLSAGVPAFFSGCLTTTTGMLFPDLDDSERPAADAPEVFVDVRNAPTGAPVVTQEYEDVRHASLAVNLRNAIDLLEGYRRRYSRVVTSRLHCYLPSRSIGATVEFAPKNPADLRFNGLLDLGDSGFTSMQRGIMTKLEQVLTTILAGKSEDLVYATWREACAADVAEAEARRASVPAIPPPSFDVAAACAFIRSRSTLVERSRPAGSGDEVHIALAYDGNLKSQTDVVVTAMVANCSAPLHLWILSRDHGPADHARFAATFPEVTVTWLPCDDVDYGEVQGMLRHTTPSTMDRLLLPDLLPELDRIVYHDIDTLPLGDLAELAGWDLVGAPLAARSAVASHVASGFTNIACSARRLRDRPMAGHDLIRRAYARHAYDFVAFNAGILVLDLARMRADEFAREFIPYVEQYGMNDQEVLNCYAGADRAVLPPEWNAFPTQEVVVSPKVIHWAGWLKPWKREYVLLRELWQEYEVRAQERRV